MSKVYIIIPARYGSTRFPGKPLAFICKKPMIQHVYERACMCEADEVYVATDDIRIIECVEGFGGKAIITSKKHRSGTDRIYEAAKKLNLKPEDIVINIQGDQPGFHPAVISLIVKPLVEENVMVSTLKHLITDKKEILDPNCVKVVTDNYGFALYFSRMPIPYHREKKGNAIYYKHLGFYGYRMEFLEIFTKLKEGNLERIEKLEQLRILENGYRIKVIESPYDSVEVNTPEDIKKAERIISF